VETPVQLERVSELGCDLYQGYLMSRPTRADRVDFNIRASQDEASELSLVPVPGAAEPVNGAAGEAVPGAAGELGPSSPEAG
jgi:hypothetical protein